MRRDFSLPPNRQKRSTLPGKSRAASVLPQSEDKGMLRDQKTKISKNNPKIAAITQLVEFLERTEYTNALSPRVLQSPSSKEVYCMFEHLVRQIDPTFRIEQQGVKAEEICINTLRILEYPNTLNKHYFATPGAPHAWPSVLKALDWLRNEIECVNDSVADWEMFSYDNEQNVAEEPAGKLKHEILVRTCMMNQMGSRLTDAEIQDFRYRTNRLFGCPNPEDVQRIETRLKDLENELSSYHNLDSQEQTLRSQIADQETRKVGLDETKTSLKSKLRDVRGNLNQLMDTLTDLEAKNTKLETELAQVRATVKAQEEAGFGGMAREFLMLRDRYNDRLKARYDLVQEVQKMQLAYSAREGKIAPALDAYNRLVGALRLPEYQAISKLCDLKICTYRANFVIAQDLPQLVHNVQTCLEKFQAAVSSSDQAVQDMNVQISNTQQAIEKLELPGLKTRLSEALNQLAKLDELVNDEDAKRLSSEREFVQDHSELCKQLDDIKRDLEKENQRITESEQLIDKEVNERLKLESYLEEVNEQLSVFLPNLQSLFEAQAAARRAYDHYMSALRHEIRSSTERIERKVSSALDGFDELLDKASQCTIDDPV